MDSMASPLLPALGFVAEAIPYAKLARGYLLTRLNKAHADGTIYKITKPPFYHEKETEEHEDEDEDEDEYDSDESDEDHPDEEGNKIIDVIAVSQGHRLSDGSFEPGKEPKLTLLYGGNKYDKAHKTPDGLFLDEAMAVTWFEATHLPLSHIQIIKYASVAEKTMFRVLDEAKESLDKNEFKIYRDMENMDEKEKAIFGKPKRCKLGRNAQRINTKWMGKKISAVEVKTSDDGEFDDLYFYFE